MRHLEHSPPYVAQIRQSWRVVVPIRGRLSPKICTPEFATQIGAIAWLQSEEGQRQIALARTTRRAIMPRDAAASRVTSLEAAAVPA